jgi:hypothetical protein
MLSTLPLKNAFYSLFKKLGVIIFYIFTKTYLNIKIFFIFFYKINR